MPHLDTPTSRCRLGVARCDITPPVGAYHRMWGAARHDRSTGVHRPLTATALVFQALAAGASGYLLKQSEVGEIHDAIVQVNQGAVPMSSHIARKVLSAFRPAPATAPTTFQDLTARESEILDLLSKGLLYKEIAEHLKVSYNTVNNHVRHIYEKLHVNTRTEAVAVYLQQPGPNRGGP